MKCETLEEEEEGAHVFSRRGLGCGLLLDWLAELQRETLGRQVCRIQTLKLLDIFCCECVYRKEIRVICVVKGNIYHLFICMFADEIDVCRWRRPLAAIVSDAAGSPRLLEDPAHLPHHIVGASRVCCHTNIFP